MYIQIKNILKIYAYTLTNFEQGKTFLHIGYKDLEIFYQLNAQGIPCFSFVEGNDVHAIIHEEAFKHLDYFSDWCNNEVCI